QYLTRAHARGTRGIRRAAPYMPGHTRCWLPSRARWHTPCAPGTIRGIHAWRSTCCKGGSTMAHTTILRTLIQAPAPLVMPGIFEGLSAGLVAQTGFAAGFISGAGLSETLLGYSDVGLMGFELNLAAVTRLVACCPLPVLADADTGYGNAVNVYHTTRGFEQ